jgi:hypothetical protein
MAKSKTRGARTSAKASKRSAKKAAQPRSTRGPKNARKATKPKSSPAGRQRAAKARPMAKKTAAARRPAAAKRTPRRVVKTTRPTARQAGGRKTAAATKPKAPTTSTARRPPNLDRERRTVAETDGVRTPPSSLNMDRSPSAARSGRSELAQKLREHTSTGPAMTAGDVDADWESAETVGDEAPGGDNPTPDQDVVEEIGKALGVEYADDEELEGGEEIVKRDRKRWELDPASSDDFDDRE